jgi:hypothetical protein
MPNDLPRDTVYVGTGYDTDLTPSAHRDTTRRRDYEDERLASRAVETAKQARS